MSPIEQMQWYCNVQCFLMDSKRYLLHTSSIYFGKSLFCIANDIQQVLINQISYSDEK